MYVFVLARGSSDFCLALVSVLEEATPFVIVLVITNCDWSKLLAVIRRSGEKLNSFIWLRSVPKEISVLTTYYDSIPHSYH